MHILVVSQYFWPENFRINDLVQGLMQRGHRVTVLTGLPNYPDGRFFKGYGLFSPRREEYCGAQVLRVPLVPRGRGGGVRLFLNYLSFALSSSTLAPFLCPKDIDVIFVFEPSPVTVGLPALAMKRVRHVPVMFWVQDLWPESLSATGAVRSATVIGWVSYLVRRIYAGCDRILVTSRAYLGCINRLGVAEEKLLYFPQSAEELYQPVSLETQRPELPPLPDGFRVMFAGNIGAAQDFATILDAAQRLKEHRDISFVIVGDGRKRSWVESEIRRRSLSDSVFLLGRHPVESMPRFFSQADVMLVTLRKEPIFALTIPAKVQSYLACGRPVIGCLDGEGGRLIKESGGGISCPAEDAAALAQAVLSMRAMSRCERERLGSLGRAYYLEHFERNKLLDRLEGWMQELCAGGAA